MEWIAKNSRALPSVPLLSDRSVSLVNVNIKLFYFSLYTDTYGIFKLVNFIISPPYNDISYRIMQRVWAHNARILETAIHYANATQQNRNIESQDRRDFAGSWKLSDCHKRVSIYINNTCKSLATPLFCSSQYDMSSETRATGGQKVF